MTHCIIINIKHQIIIKYSYYDSYNKPELKSYPGPNPACGVSEICDVENL